MQLQRRLNLLKHINNHVKILWKTYKLYTRFTLNKNKLKSVLAIKGVPQLTIGENKSRLAPMTREWTVVGANDRGKLLPTPMINENVNNKNWWSWMISTKVGSYCDLTKLSCLAKTHVFPCVSFYPLTSYFLWNQYLIIHVSKQSKHSIIKKEYNST